MCICTSLCGTLAPDPLLPGPRECPVLPLLLEAAQQHLKVDVSGMQDGTAGHGAAAVGTGMLAHLSSLWVGRPFHCDHVELLICYLHPQDSEPARSSAISVQASHLDNLL